MKSGVELLDGFDRQRVGLDHFIPEFCLNPYWRIFEKKEKIKHQNPAQKRTNLT